MTRTLTLHYLGVTYQIKLRTILNSDHSSIVVWRDETALTGTSFHGAKSNKEAKAMADRLLSEYYEDIWKQVRLDIAERIGTGLCY